jgi:hypothetical protein
MISLCKTYGISPVLGVFEIHHETKQEITNKKYADIAPINKISTMLYFIVL